MKKDIEVPRLLEDVLKKWLFSGKILTIYGARQVGKTTLVKRILSESDKKTNYYNCEYITIQQLLESKTPGRIKDFFGDTNLIVLDEAQNVKNIGKILKLLIDAYPDFQIIATGSSSFELASKTNEALTGRALQFTLYPFSLPELKAAHSKVDIIENLSLFIRFGLYPEIVLSGEQEKVMLLNDLADKYLYRDVLSFENLKKSDILVKLLQSLALQLGNEVSTNELAQKLGVTRTTIDKYINILEQSFIIFRLKPFGRNLRNEITRKNKIYFYDTGIRNSIIQNFAPLDLRNDIGPLWENFLLIERKKHLQHVGKQVNQYFWRTHDKKEIDYIEEYDGKLHGYEFKWNPAKKTKTPHIFLDTYAGSSITVINKDNFLTFIGM